MLAAPFLNLCPSALGLALRLSTHTSSLGWRPRTLSSIVQCSRRGALCCIHPPEQRHAAAKAGPVGSVCLWGGPILFPTSGHTAGPPPRSLPQEDCKVPPGHGVAGLLPQQLLLAMTSRIMRRGGSRETLPAHPPLRVAAAGLASEILVVEPVRFGAYQATAALLGQSRRPSRAASTASCGHRPCSGQPAARCTCSTRRAAGAGGASRRNASGGTASAAPPIATSLSPLEARRSTLPNSRASQHGGGL
mmetsp:Transcript_24136/g.57490  ORF Transcript_24136/g.57490 Transcript_24136/m.57490 type:complete len:248 (-) Transcript_24136:1012-1755(-)